MAFDYAANAGAGHENIDKSVLGMPLIGIIQKGSPQYDETHKKYATQAIQGCKAGDLYFAPTNSVLKRPFEVIVTGSVNLYTEWRPNKGGFAGNQPLTITGDKGYHQGKPGTKEQHREYLGENELVYTIYVAVIFKMGDKWESGFIPFTSKQLTKARSWLKALRNLKVPGTEIEAPLFAGVWAINTGPESNDEGGWFGFTISLVRVLDATKDEETLVYAQEEFKHTQARLPSPRQQMLAESGEKKVGEDPY